MGSTCLNGLKIILIIVYITRILVFSFLAYDGYTHKDQKEQENWSLLLIQVLLLCGSVIGMVGVVREGKTTLLIMIVLEVVGITLSIAIGHFGPTVVCLLTVIALSLFYCTIDQKRREGREGIEAMDRQTVVD